MSLLLLPQTAFAQRPTSSMPTSRLYPEFTVHHVASTNNTDGDTNPYGVAIVPKTISGSMLTAGDILVTEFNSSSTMGAGTSIVEVNPTTGSSTVFYQSAAITGPVGIAINPTNDYVWVSYYGAASDGSKSGYAVINPTGQLVANYTNTNSSHNGSSDLFEGAWGAAFAPGAFFWTNAGAANPTANGMTGQVWRLNPNPTGTSNGQPLNSTYVPLATDLPTSDLAGTPVTPSTVAGPEGVVYDAANRTLYVTDDYNNAIYAIPNALGANPGAPVMIAQNGALNAPQGIAIDPINHALLVVNGAGNNDLVELTTTGHTIGTRTLDSGAAGALFGIATMSGPSNGQFGLYFDDSNTSSLDEFSAPSAGYQGYQFAQAHGSVQAYGIAHPPAPPAVTGKVVGMAYAAGGDGTGYWEVTSSGAVYAAGTAKNYGGLTGRRLSAPIVGIASTPDGMGYWLVGADGGVFNFGDAGFYGNTYTDGLTGLTGMHPLSAPIVGIASTPDGMGYWLVGADGGVFNFGDAGFYGNTYTDGLTGLTGMHPLNKPILGILSTPTGAGYWLLAQDGGVFDFGNARFSGSAASKGMIYTAIANPLL